VTRDAVISRPQVPAQSHEGACHCRAIDFVYRTSLAPEAWQIRACQCTFCRIHAALSTSDPNGSLRFNEHVPGALNRYRFGYKTTDFLVCRNCGAYVGPRWSLGARASASSMFASCIPCSIACRRHNQWSTKTKGRRYARRAEKAGGRPSQSDDEASGVGDDTSRAT
jgi:hypothetical protein